MFLGLACSFVHANRVDDGHTGGLLCRLIHRCFPFLLRLPFFFIKLREIKNVKKNIRAKPVYICVYNTRLSCVCVV